MLADVNFLRIKGCLIFLFFLFVFFQVFWNESIFGNEEKL